MATSHYCDGKWRSGTVAECDRHKRLDKNQTSVYARSSESGPSESGSGESSGSGASSGSGKSSDSSSDKS